MHCSANAVVTYIAILLAIYERSQYTIAFMCIVCTVFMHFISSMYAVSMQCVCSVYAVSEQCICSAYVMYVNSMRIECEFYVH